jgi:hypothetical protein
MTRFDLTRGATEEMPASYLLGKRVLVQCDHGWDRIEPTANEASYNYLALIPIVGMVTSPYKSTHRLYYKPYDLNDNNKMEIKKIDRLFGDFDLGPKDGKIMTIHKPNVLINNRFIILVRGCLSVCDESPLLFDNDVVQSNSSGSPQSRKYQPSIILESLTHPEFAIYDTKTNKEIIVIKDDIGGNMRSTYTTIQCLGNKIMVTNTIKKNTTIYELPQ